MIRFFSAHTTFPNTPETDGQPKVMHTVHFAEDDQEKSIQIMAECPLTAIEKAKKLLEKRG